MKRYPNFELDALEAKRWAKRKLSEDFYILDLETTGIDNDSEAIEIGLLDKNGDTFEARIKPLKPVPDNAFAVHKISNSDLENCPSFIDIYGLLDFYFSQKQILIYNAPFDLRILAQQCKLNNLPNFSIKADCVMHQYSKYCGEWSSYHGSYRWQKLPSADHSAIGDCKATLKLLKKMADWEALPPKPPEWGVGSED